MNEKLALNDDILMKIEKPARYIGNEVNAVVKDRDSIDVRFCMCFPDVYEIGMSHLGIQILYGMLNSWDDVWCERVYSPWVDLDEIMRKENIPLFALESQDPIKDFDFLGITIQYEMCYTNILQVLDLAGIPLLATERGEDCPIVIGGGPCTYNPEPIADFFDIFYIGEGETVYGDLIELYKIYKHSDMTREEFLIKVSQIPGLYVPALYDVTYHEDGTIASFGPKYEEVPKTILKQVVTDMSSAVYPEKPVVSYMKVTQDRVVLEIMRGCIRGCRFCQAGMIYRPTRPKDVNVLKHYAEAMLDNTGQEEITFSSLSSSDYQSLPELTDCLIEKMDNNHVNISLPSLRIDAFSLDVMQKIQDIMNSLRQNPPAEFAGHKVVAVRDYKADTIKNLETGEVTPTGLPNSNVLYYELTNDAWVCVRPSGTEPKVKFYYGVKGTSLADADEKSAVMGKAVLDMVDSMM